MGAAGWAVVTMATVFPQYGHFTRLCPGAGSTVAPQAGHCKSRMVSGMIPPGAQAKFTESVSVLRNDVEYRLRDGAYSSSIPLSPQSPVHPTLSANNRLQFKSCWADAFSMLRFNTRSSTNLFYAGKKS